MPSDRSEQDRRIGNLEGALAVVVSMYHASLHSDTPMTECGVAPCKGAKTLLAGTGLLPSVDEGSAERESDTQDSIGGSRPTVGPALSGSPSADVEGADGG